MHQIRFRLWLRPRPCWGSSQRSSGPPSWILGVPILREERGGKRGRGKRRTEEVRRGAKGEGREERWKSREREGEGKRDQTLPPQWKFLATPLCPWQPLYKRAGQLVCSVCWHWRQIDGSTLCLKKNRTPITFWNNSNKLCLIKIMISWENRQKVLNIVVCYGLTIFHKTGYQLRLFPR